MDEVIALFDVTKIFRLGFFRRKVGVENLTLTVPRGEVVGLLGPNGSGKSTTLKMILGFLKPTSGNILVCGHPVEERRAREFIGYLPENPRFQKFLTATDILHYYGRLLGLGGQEIARRSTELLERVGLRFAAVERVQGFSKGMTQRLAIAQALLNRPSLLIFDEPMSGLDPIGRMEIRHLIAGIHADMPNTTIFFSTHILADVEELCSWVALLRGGKLAAFSDIDQLLSGDCERYDVVVKNIPPGLKTKLTSDLATKMTAAGMLLEIQGTENLIQQLNALKNAGASVVTVQTQRKNLEQALFVDAAPVKTMEKAS